MIFAALLGKAIGAFFENRREKAKAEQQQYLAELKAGLHDPNKLRPLKWASFTLFTAPMIGMYFWPDNVTLFMENLDALPDWYLQQYLLITGSIWGVAVGKDILEGIIRAVKKR